MQGDAGRCREMQGGAVSFMPTPLTCMCSPTPYPYSYSSPSPYPHPNLREREHVQAPHDVEQQAHAQPDLARVS